MPALEHAAASRCVAAARDVRLMGKLIHGRARASRRTLPSSQAAIPCAFPFEVTLLGCSAEVHTVGTPLWVSWGGCGSAELLAACRPCRLRSWRGCSIRRRCGRWSGTCWAAGWPPPRRRETSACGAPTWAASGCCSTASSASRQLQANEEPAEARVLHALPLCPCGYCTLRPSPPAARPLQSTPVMWQPVSTRIARGFGARALQVQLRRALAPGATGHVDKP